MAKKKVTKKPAKKTAPKKAKVTSIKKNAKKRVYTKRDRAFWGNAAVKKAA